MRAFDYVEAFKSLSKVALGEAPQQFTHAIFTIVYYDIQ